MRPILLSLPLVLTAVACRPATTDRPAATDSTPPATTQAEPWTIRLDGVGPLTFGMSLAQARAAGVRLMVEAAKVVRVDVDSAGTRTAAGAAVGMAEADVRGRYPDGLQVRPHKYDPKGRYLIVQGTAEDSAQRLIFETDGQRVVRYRAGVTPAVEYVEGCA